MCKDYLVKYEFSSATAYPVTVHKEINCEMENPLYNHEQQETVQKYVTSQQVGWGQLVPNVTSGRGEFRNMPCHALVKNFHRPNNVYSTCESGYYCMQTAK